MRTLLILTALLAAAPAMAGGHRSHDVDRTTATASRANRGGAQVDRNRSSRSTQVNRNTRSQSRVVHQNRNNVRRAAPGPRTTYRAPARTYRAPARTYRAPARTVTHRRVDPWVRGYRGVHRSGFVWVDGCYVNGGWTPGYYQPINHRAGYVWVHGYWNGYDYVQGYWRPVQRRGHVWVDGYYNGRTWVRGGWQVRVQGRRGGVVVYR